MRYNVAAMIRPEKLDAITRLYEWGIVSREFLVNKLDIEDDGKTFFDPQAANMKPEQINTRDTQTETNPTG